MNKHENTNTNSHSGRKKTVYKTISIVSGIIAILAIIGVGIYLFTMAQARREYAELSEEIYIPTPAPTAEPTPIPTPESSPEPTPEPTPEPVHIPVNFEALQSINSDVIAWVEVEGTDIDYPVLYDTSDDMYYLDHTYRGTYTTAGSIFIQDYNTDDFSDFNTVLYGHNMADRSMFAQLHDFRNSASFFEENDTIIIYTPDRKLTYEIFAAYRTNNLNILGNYAVETAEDREAYLDHVYSHSEIARFDYNVDVTEADRIITLSTCIGHDSYRYVVQGVLVSEEAGVQGE